MKTLIVTLFTLSLAFTGCRETTGPLVDTRFTDSLLTHYQPSAFEKMISQDLAFWKTRLAGEPGSYTALSRYSGDLVQRFHLYGDIQDLLTADSITNLLNDINHGEDAGTWRSKAALDITRHRFKEADNFVQKALSIGSEKYTSTLMSFDTRFELGSYTLAGQALKNCAATNEYGYFFRLSKWMHLQGETDSAIYYMKQAANWSGNSSYLLQTANSNLGDLYMHEGSLAKAAVLYRDNLQKNAADYHSLLGLGKIALMNDDNPAAAERIFRFIAAKNALPDPYYFIEWVAEQKGDTALQKQYARTYVEKTQNSHYGGMYHKYQIELYTGILHNPEKALELARDEIHNRATPQTYTWLVWALHKSGKDAEAMQVYKAHVSGKPLEALELFWIGKMMRDLGKNYNAEAFFKAAYKNRFDLSPEKQKELQDYL
ncbi:MAG: hypothetical protein KGO92_12615 [Bacteroidota bacterium]|nr:hypothetical protein [Bacteroidota bacterium]